MIEGWQHATQQQLAALFASDTVQSLMDTLGGPNVQNASFYALIGIYDAPALDNVAWLAVTRGFVSSGFNGFADPTFLPSISGQLGHFLVSDASIAVPIPEPSTYLMMMALDLLALVVARRKAKRASR